MNDTQVIKLKIKGTSFDYSKCVNAFPTRTKEKSVEEMREAVLTNMRTKVEYSDKEEKPTVRVAYGNEYIRFNPKDKKSTCFTYEEFDITKEQFEEYEDDFNEVLRTDVESGRFDDEIKRISQKMSDARN